MNFDEVVVKESPGLCRCCLSEGCYKDLGYEYTWMNETEIYADMLLECFDISISQHTDGPNGSNRLICEVCITRLRDACNFKKQVLESEKKFIDMLARGEFQPKLLMYQANAPMKAEELLEEPAPDDAEVEYLEDVDFDDDLPLKQALELSAAAAAAQNTTEVVKVKGKRGRPRKNPVVEKKPRTKSEDKPKTSKAVAKGTSSELTATKRNRLVKRNAILILENTTTVPFKWHRQDYLCFFCHKNFKKFDNLKEHTNEHKTSNIKSAVSYLRRDEKVKIDVSELNCKICNKKFNNLKEILAHLKVKHDIKFSEGIDYGVVPYRMYDNSFQCDVCTESFQYFVKLNQHLNEHFGTYICEACGKTFLSQDRLRCHALSHGEGYHCKHCPETFDSLTLRDKHERKIHHQNKSLKCLYCSETFKSYNERKKHHHTVHNVPMQQFACPVCNKIFYISSKMEVHLKEVHIREKNFSCNMCEQKFFSKTHLQKHLIRHVGDRVHFCEICNKGYARKQTLKVHMKIHNNEKKYVCNVCNQGFVQNNSLKLHLKVHHLVS